MVIIYYSLLINPKMWIKFSEYDFAPENYYCNARFIFRDSSGSLIASLMWSAGCVQNFHQMCTSVSLLAGSQSSYLFTLYLRCTLTLYVTLYFNFDVERAKQYTLNKPSFSLLFRILILKQQLIALLI